MGIGFKASIYTDGLIRVLVLLVHVCMVIPMNCLLSSCPSCIYGYSYFPEPHIITYLVGLASSAFVGLGIYVASGHPFLGGLIGEPDQCS